MKFGKALRNKVTKEQKHSKQSHHTIGNTNRAASKISKQKLLPHSDHHRLTTQFSLKCRPIQPECNTSFHINNPPFIAITKLQTFHQIHKTPEIYAETNTSNHLLLQIRVTALHHTVESRTKRQTLAKGPPKQNNTGPLFVFQRPIFVSKEQFTPVKKITKLCFQS